VVPEKGHEQSSSGRRFLIPELFADCLQILDSGMLEVLAIAEQGIDAAEELLVAETVGRY
jgi:hypothetical protein